MMMMLNMYLKTMDSKLYEKNGSDGRELFDGESNFLYF